MLPRACACGCGETFRPKRSIVRYIRHHQGRGKKLSEEHKRKVSLTLTQYYTDNKHHSKGTRHTTGTKKKMSLSRKKFLATHKAFSSKIESRAARFLPEFQHKFWLDGHPFDYGSKNLKIVVEINGCFWHGHRCKDATSHRPGKIQQQVMMRDAVVNTIAKNNGYRLIVLWQCEYSKWSMKKIMAGDFDV